MRLPVGGHGPPGPVCVPENTPYAETFFRSSSVANDLISYRPSGRIPIRPFIHSVYCSSVWTSARGSACAANVALGRQYALHTSHPFPASHASKNSRAIFAIDGMVATPFGGLGRMVTAG